MKKQLMAKIIIVWSVILLSCSKLQFTNLLHNTEICPKEGEWITSDEEFSFTIKECKIIKYILRVVSNYSYIYFHSATNILIPISHSRFYYEVKLKEGGIYTISGLFISITSGQGTWTWQEQRKDWIASPKIIEVKNMK